MELVFFGTGPVAAKSLLFIASKFKIEAVITKPHPVAHRGHSPVLEVAKKLELQTFTPNNKKELSELFLSKPVKSTLGVVVDYGIIIPQEVIDYFPKGIINSHFSLLPQWRGADPITFAILSGQKRTGVSLMVITAGLDEGPLIAQSMYSIPEKSTGPTLTEALINASNKLLHSKLPLYEQGDLAPVPQEVWADKSKISTKPTYSKKITKQDGVIVWDKPAVEIEREIRAFVEWPKSRTVLAGKDVIITSADIMKKQGKTGDFEIVNHELYIFCGKDSLKINTLKPAGKEEMAAEAFLAGYGHLIKK